MRRVIVGVALVLLGTVGYLLIGVALAAAG